uniref:Uncharacterized protein n=1 Tax=viral metagenome TaxID=1070528 RepID=A0A6C0DPJ1_9ZZZZ
MDPEQIESLFSSSVRPNFKSMDDEILKSIIKHYGLKGSDKPTNSMATLLDRTWLNFQANKLYNELFEYMESNEDAKAIETVKKLKDIIPNKLGEINAQKDSETPLVFAINNENIDVAFELVKTGYSKPGTIVNGETALLSVIDSYIMSLEFNKRMELMEKKIELALAIIATGKSNAGYISEYNEKSALMMACTKKELLGVAVAIIKKDKTNINAVFIDEDDEYSALDYLIEEDLIDNDAFRELIKYYVLENPHDEQFQSVTVKTICALPELKEEVKKSLQSVPELRDMNIEDYCLAPVSASAEIPIPVGVATNDSEGSTTSVNEAIEVPITAAYSGTDVNDGEYYIDENGRRISVPLMSEGEGERIAKRLGGKTLRKKRNQIKKKPKTKKRGHKKTRTNKRVANKKSKKSH